MSFPLLFLLSVAAGFVGAMSGLGGGVILIPALTTLGLDIKHAIAVSMVSVIATSSGAASAYLRDRLTNLRVGMFLELFTIVGALAGASITVAAPRGPLFVLFGVVLLGSFVALWMSDGQARREVPPDRLSRWLGLEGSYVERQGGEVVRYHASRAWLGGPLMLVAGLVAGLLGIGAGALKVLVQELIMRLPTKVSTTTSNLIIGVTALSGSGVFLAAGLVDPSLCAPVILGVVSGAFVGTRVLVRISNRAVRRVFLVVLAVLGVEMIVRGVGGGGG